MKIALYKKTCANNGHPIMDALAQYLKNEAIIIKDNTIIKSDVAVIWSVLWTNNFRKQIWDYCHQNNIPVLVLEVGGLIRNKTWKFGINGINAEANFAHKNSPPGRFEKFGLTLEPWKRNENGSIIICGQNDKSGAWYEGNMSAWILKTISQIRKYTDRHIIIRPHPRASVSLPDIKNVSIIPPIFSGGYDNFNFSEALKEAWAVVSYNSNPAIESALNGIPIFTHKSSLCWEISNPDFSTIENPLYPDRSQWINDISFTEWFEDEIKDGIPWKRLF